MLIPLYYRAQESNRPDAIIKEEQAVEVVQRLDYDYSQFDKIRVHDGNKVARFILTREIERFVRDFLHRNPEALVVHIGCGLDSHFERVDNGSVEWYDLDLSEVIELRRQYLGDEHGRYHFLTCSVVDENWFDEIKAREPQSVLFVAENVLVYFTEVEVKSLMQKLCCSFPGAELVFDAWSPIFIKLGNFQLAKSKFAGLLRWSFLRARKLERWDKGIRLLGQWGFFEKPEPRMAPYRWIAPLFYLLKPMRILHYKLGV